MVQPCKGNLPEIKSQEYGFMKYEKHFDAVTDGFCGSYYPLRGKTDKAFIAMFGDDTDPFHPAGGYDEAAGSKVADRLFCSLRLQRSKGT